MRNLQDQTRHEKKMDNVQSRGDICINGRNSRKKSEEMENSVHLPAATAATRPAPAATLPPPRVKMQRNQPRDSFLPLRSKSGRNELAALNLLILPAYGGYRIARIDSSQLGLEVMGRRCTQTSKLERPR